MGLLDNNLMLLSDARNGEIAKSTKGLVIAALASEAPSPLTLSEIAGFIEWRFKRSFDLPEIRRAVDELEAIGAVVRRKNTYKLSIAWVKKIKEFLEELCFARQMPFPEGTKVTRTGKNSFEIKRDASLFGDA